MKALSVPLLLLPAPLAAHPHVFVDTAMEVVVEGGAVTAVRLTWSYDAFFSLLLTEDLGLDPDGDAALTPAELARLRESVADWPPDFEGDLVVTQAGTVLPLGPRQEHDVAFVDGRMVETHLRPLATPAPADLPVVIENFDPYYYVAYAISPEVAVAGGEGCAATHVAADPVAAQAEVDAVWQGLDVAGAGPEVQLPPIGYAFSDRVEVLCGA